MGWLLFLVSAGAAMTLAAALLHPSRDGLGTLRRLTRRRFPEVAHLAPAELAEWLASPHKPRPVLLDVRPADAFAESHLAGALSVPNQYSLAETLSALPKNQPVVVYCFVGYSASEAALRLTASGRPHVWNLDGGIVQWLDEGRMVERNGAAIRDVHSLSELVRRFLRVEPPS